MEIQDFWNIYAGGYSPAEFVWRFGKGNAAVSVKEYTNSCPAMYGILRNTTWKKTFAAAEQYNRERVSAALLTHLELTRETWESHVQEYAAAEAAARLAEQKRAEAEALAAAIARVEAEAREKAAANACATEVRLPEQPEDLPQEVPVPNSFHSLGLSQARTAEDAAAITAAMARVEAEAKEKAAREAQEQQQPVSTILETGFVEPNHAVQSEQDGSPNV